MVAQTWNKSPLVNKFLSSFVTVDEELYLRHISPRTGSAQKQTCKFPLKRSPQKPDRNCYFVVNGQGHKDFDIKEGRAFWIEHDDLSIEEQTNLWKTLQLPEPTWQVFTGGKSIHTYWLLSKPIAIDLWQQLENDLIKYTKADPSIKNPSRVLRVPGCDYLDKRGNKRGEVTIIHPSVDSQVKLYSYEDLRKAVPVIRETPKKSTVTRKKQVLSYGEVTDKWVDEALKTIDPDCGYDDWFAIGASLVSHYGETEGLRLWDNWSSKGSKYQGTQELERKVKTFTGSKVQELRLFFNIAKRYGFKFKKFESGFASKSDSSVEMLTIISKSVTRDRLSSKSVQLEYSSDEELMEIIKDKNHKLICLTDPTGLGKTYTIGKLRWDLYHVAKDNYKSTVTPELRANIQRPSVFYIDQNHNNPSDENIERDFVNLEPRVKGWVRDNTKKTALGFSYRHASHKDNYDFEGNCIRSGVFNVAFNNGLNDQIYQKTTINYPNGGSKVVGNMICGTCPKAMNCKFLNDRLEVLGHPVEIMNEGEVINLHKKGKFKERKPLIRADIHQLKEVLNPFDIAVIDEFDKTLQSMKTTKLTIGKLHHDYGLIVHKYPELESLIKPLYIEVENLLEESKKHRYGLDHLTIKEKLQRLNLDWEKLKTAWEDQIDWMKEMTREFESESLFGTDTYESISTDLLNNGLGLILDCLSGDKNIVFATDRYGNLTLNSRIDFDYQVPHKIIALTATPLPKEQVSQATGIPEESIVYVRKKTSETLNNLTVKVITDCNGIGSNFHTPKAQEKISKFVESLDLNNTLVRGHKKYKESYQVDSHYWGNDERGSNQYKERDRYLSFGLPYDHLGNQEIKYRLATSNYSGEIDRDKFDRFNRHSMESNLLQGLGRLRAVKRDEKLEALIFCKELEVQFLADYGYSVVTSDLTDNLWCKELMNDRQKLKAEFKAQIGEYLVDKIQRGLKPKLADFAKWLATTGANLSKVISSLGLTFDDVKKTFQSLIRVYKENGNFLISSLKDKMNDSQKWLKSSIISACSSFNAIPKASTYEEYRRIPLFKWLPHHTDLLYDLCDELEKASDSSHLRRIIDKFGFGFYSHCWQEYLTNPIKEKILAFG